MPIIIDRINGGLSEPHEEIIKKALGLVRLSERDVKVSGINRVSLDARKRGSIHFVYSVYAQLNDTSLEKKLAEKKLCRLVRESSLSPLISDKPKNGEIVIAGFGPAGMFCSLVLAKYGYRPIVLERGRDVDSRVRDVEGYWSGGRLDPDSNVQFGEGGAGTFSDGKLTTRINDPLCRFVLERFVEFGAPEEILIKSKPHIGTDKLRGIVKGIRQEVVRLGGRVMFESRLSDMTIEDRLVKSVLCGGSEIKTAALVLAVGHSARDTFEMAAKRGISMCPKPFSVGVRIEHRQKDVDESLYGRLAGDPKLPKGEYQLSHRRADGRCVYTFCMCPGGHVVPAASEEGTIVTNGMSRYARDGENANSALVVSVSENDFGHGILDGVDFVRSLERRAFGFDGKRAPACTVRGFLNGSPDIDTSIVPTYDRGILPCSFTSLFPHFVTDMMREGLDSFSKKMKCFGDGNALMTAPETRTSSPLRMLRSEKLSSLSADNLYPCGEGAGYAGGIMSAAVDGVKTALAIMENMSPE